MKEFDRQRVLEAFDANMLDELLDSEAYYLRDFLCFLDEEVKLNDWIREWVVAKGSQGQRWKMGVEDKLTKEV